MDNLKHIEVSCGLIVDRKHHILVGKIPSGKKFAGKWEFPGGKIFKNEPPEDAIIREAIEELGCKIQPKKYLGYIEHDYEELSVTLHVYLCVIPKDPPNALVHHELRWVSQEQLHVLDLVDADKMIVRQLKSSGYQWPNRKTIA